jgi:hypothetical protein
LNHKLQKKMTLVSIKREEESYDIIILDKCDRPIGY